LSTEAAAHDYGIATVRSITNRQRARDAMALNALLEERREHGNAKKRCCRTTTKARARLELAATGLKGR